MSRTTNKLKTPPVKPVQKIELTDKNNKKKIILVILLLALGLTAIGYGLMSAISTERGWKEIKANNTEEINCSSDFVFMYNIGAGDTSPTVENKAITNLYSDATVNAYKIFTSDVGYEDINNIFTMNQHPNEELMVEPALYEAFELLEKYGNRNMYLAPVYMQYDDIFFSTDESEIVEYDPRLNEEVANYYKEIAVYANNSDAVKVKLLGDNKVMLCVSDEYMSFAKENDITRFIDLFWMKNAFVADYLAETMSEKGFNRGTISSHDGFSCVLDESDSSYSFHVYDKVDDVVRQVAVAGKVGSQNIVCMRNFLINDLDKPHYYELKNGEVRTSYLDMEDGTCKSAVDMLISYGKEMGCAEIMLNIESIYIADELDQQAVVDLALKNVYSVYCKDSVIYYNDSELDLSNVDYSTSMMK